MNIKIEKNVPITNQPRGSISMLAREMQFGDSVVVDTISKLSSFRSAIERKGWKPISRREGKGWRIWKTKRET